MSRAPDELWEELVARYAGDAAVTPPSGGKAFGASALKVGGKIFAMLTEGRLVVKLPRQRVDELVGAGTGGPFEAGGGRVMREWVTVSPAHGEEWPALADEAHRFVGGAEVG